MLHDLTQIPSPLDFNELFGRPGPVEIEIGVGKGRFLKEYALAFPAKNLIGIEKSRKWLLHAQERLEKANVTNVCLFVAFAESFLAGFVPDASVEVYHVYFPDPWPKRRHHKRRLFGPRFLGEAIRTLVPDGAIHIATDHEEYLSLISSELASAAREGLTFERVARGPFVTNFQAKYEKEGRPIYFLRGTKTGPSPAPSRRSNEISAPSDVP